MKPGRNVIPLLLCFSIVLASLLVLIQPAAAKSKDSEHITITEPVMVGGTLLEPDTYKLEWENSGPQVQVSFIRGSKIIATVPATLVLEETRYDGAVATKTLADNSKVLEKISWKKKSLVFEPSS